MDTTSKESTKIQQHVDIEGHVGIDEHIGRDLEYSAAYRWQHWIRAFSIIFLIATGFYLAVPVITPTVTNEPTNFMYALFRTWHIIIGFVFIAAILLKSYLFIFAKKHENERAALWDVINPIVWVKQIGFYLLISKHPKLRGVYNPMQFLSYTLFYVMAFGLIITGLILFVHVYHEGLGGFLYEPMRSIEVMLGGLAFVRELHHILMWGVILFIVIHIYIAVYNAVFIKEGTIDAIISGIKWHKRV
ncbi:MAG: Ni/Fe-hydrogenase, b-type cytochrome subunit [Helicobacteraceae bacterium]|nr:Ni/Fe-hydrogenase, b-type cytochrome subunit [Candidatus Sulfurimonas ponti]MBL6973741.1 Ni/Fe-hydrogenase, b-type cytochrome subunit [Sulfurimonas sp.]